MRAPRAAPALLVLLLAPGCLDSSAPADLPPGTGGRPGPFVAVESMVAGDRGGGEPSLGVTPDGVLFTVLRSMVYRSADEGRTWASVGDPGAPMPNGDPDLAVDADGTVWESRLWIGCAEVATSRDQGETWASNPASCPGVVGDRQYVVPTRGGEAYLYFHQIPTFWMTAVKTSDHGRTWTPTGLVERPDHHLLVNGGSGWGGGGFWNPSTGSVFLTFTDSNGGGHRPTAPAAAFAVTRDGGETWEVRHAHPLEGAPIGLGLVTGAADDAGNVYLAWAEAHADDVAVYAAASRDDGRTWTPKVRMDQGIGSVLFPVIVAGQPGRVAVAYYEGSEASPADSMEGTWNVTLAWTDSFLGGAPVQHGRLTTAPVKHGPICGSGTVCGGDREFADYFDAVRMPDGRVAATYNVLPEGQAAVRNGFSLTAEPLLGPVP